MRGISVLRRVIKRIKIKNRTARPIIMAIPAAAARGRRCLSSHKQTGRRAYARINAVRKGVKISAILLESSRIQ
jgi:hypothetical protein